MAVIEAKGVSIRYIIGDLKNIGLKEYIMRRIRGDYHVTEFWADKDITFKLEKGDMLGIVGSNGAGKSTLLTAMSGIMEPTSGSIITNGRVSSILELTAGFDGDLTAKENAYLRGAMLGYSEEFMDKMYSSIIEFAELQEFQDIPIKQFSSGMRARLAFSIACLVNPDIFIIDEVLAVGDGAFRKKSSQKMKEILNIIKTRKEYLEQKLAEEEQKLAENQEKFQSLIKDIFQEKLYNKSHYNLLYLSLLPLALSTGYFSLFTLIFS